MKNKFLRIARVLKQQLFLKKPKNQILFLLMLLTGLSVNGSPRKGGQKYHATAHKHKKALLTNPTLSYNSPNTFYKGKAITPLAPASTGVGTPGYNTPVVIGQTGIHLPAGTAVDGLGNVYVSSHENLSNTSIIKIPANGGPLTQIGFGFSQPGALAVDAAGDVFAVDGQNIKEILAGTTNTITIGTTGNFSSPHAIAVDASNNIYVADGSPDVPGIKEFQYAAGSYSSSYIMIGSGFNMPFGVAVDGTGNVYVADNGNNAIKKIAAGNGPVTTVAAFTYPLSIALDNSGNLFVAGGSETYGSIVKLPAGNYNSPVTYGSGIENATDLSVDASGNVYLADVNHDEIKEIPAGNGNPVTLAPGFDNTEAVAVDGAGNVFVADAYNGAVREIPASGGNYPLTLAPGFNFSLPYGVAVDAADNVYVGDAGAGMIYKIAQGSNTAVAIGSALSNVLSVAVDAKGNVFACSGGADLYEVAAGSNTTAVVATGFSSLQSVAVDAAGNVYGYDLGNNSVYKLPPGGAGTPVALATGISRGHYLTVDVIGNVYVGFNGNGNPSGIEEISAANGAQTMVATTAGPPYGVAIDGAGNLYCTDVASNLADNVIDKITPGGGYYISRALPAGLTFDSNTGIITGTPGALSPATNYTVTAYNSTGSISATVNIAVVTNEATLSGLKLSSGSLTPAFATGTTIYTAAVGNGVASVTVTPTASYPGAAITVNTASVASGTPSGAIPLNVGPNTISVMVTAPGGGNTETYTITVTRAPSSNAALAGLSISHGSLSPAFSTGTTSYTDAVGNNVTALTVKPTAAGAGATITVNGTAVLSGTTSQSIPIAEGSNNISIMITAQDGVTTGKYTITVNRAPSSVAALAGLSMSNGTLSPAFSTLTTSYSVSEATTVTAVTVKPTAAGVGATIKVNGTVVTSGTPSQSIALAPGANTISIVVTAQDGVTANTYTVTVTQVLSNDALLSMLSISTGTLSPAFNTNTTVYTAAEDSYVTSVTVKPKASGVGATITVNGTVVSSGAPSPGIPLIVGPNTITIAITAQDDVTKQTYTLTVTRAASNNAGLANLGIIGGGSLSPAFSTPTTGYTVAEDHSVASVKVKPTAAATGATIKVNGVTTTSGSVSASIPLAVGPNTIDIVVTAPDGVTMETYTITATRAASNVAALAGLTISSGALSPTFSTTVTSYAVSVDNTVTSMTVKPTVAGVGATVTVNGTTVTSGTSSQSIPLAVGANVVSIVVTAQDGVTTDTYTITVTQAPGGVDQYNPGISVTNPAETPKLADGGIVVHQGVSPNGDGINDFLQIDNISRYPDNKLSIMSRNGQLIYEAKGYDNRSRVFDGHSNKNGQMQLPGTYFYALDYTVNGITKHKTGYLVLKY